jgi:cobalamin biosynthesis protein CobT
MMDGETQALVQKAIELAKKGDTAALRLCLDRIAPRRKERFIDFPLPKITNRKEAIEASALIVNGVTEGQITPGEAEALMRIVHTHVGIIGVEDLEHRVAEMERAVAKEREVRPGQPGWRNAEPVPTPLESTPDEEDTAAAENESNPQADPEAEAKVEPEAAPASTTPPKPPGQTPPTRNPPAYEGNSGWMAG